MTESEIIEAIAKTRGTILCLGLNAIPPLSILGISAKPITWPNLLIIPSEKKMFSEVLKCFFRGSDWRIVNGITNLPLNSLFIVTSIPQIEKNISSDADYDIDTYLDSIHRYLNLQAISIIDSFPFHTKEGLQQIERIHKYCQKKGVAFNMGLLFGVNKYGSTDISTEEEAVKQEKEYLSEEKNIECIEINKTLSVDNVVEFLLDDSTTLTQAVEAFKQDCMTTMQNLELMDDILKSFLLIPLNASTKEYIDHVRNTLKELDVLFPCCKYLNEQFFVEFGKAIFSKFNSRRDSTNNEVSKWCVDTLSCAIKQWIKTSKLN